MAGNWMRLEIDGRVENLGLCRLAVAAFASGLGFTIPELDEIKVMVSEAVSNAIVHGYRDRGGSVRLEAHALSDGIEILVADDGCGIENVAQAREPAYSTDPERMGLGFVFMESFSDSLEVESELQVGTTVRLTKRHEPAGGGGDAPAGTA